MIKVRRRPTPELDLPPGCQHGDGKPTVWYVPSQGGFYRMTGDARLDRAALCEQSDAIAVTNFYTELVGKVPVESLAILAYLSAGERLAALDRHYGEGWNVIEGDHDL